MTHWMAETVVYRSWPMVAAATLTIEVSSSAGIAPVSKTMMSLTSEGSSRPDAGVASVP